MWITAHAGSESRVRGNADADLKEIVMGLHWDPPKNGVSADAVDLDAMCVLFDAQQGVLEVIHPGHPRSADHSVIHTGDSRTGAGAWDDERIFVFLEALPPAVSALAFVVVSATGRSFHETHGAFCHVSDCSSEDERIRLELTPLVGCSGHVVATLHRGAAGWKIAAGTEMLAGDLLAELRTLAGRAKNSEAPTQR